MTFDFIDCWLKLFDYNDIERSNMYIEAIKGFFEKIPVELPKPQSLIEKLQSLLHAIGGEWYIKKKEQEYFTPKKAKNKQKSQEKEAGIKRNLQMENQSWN